MTRSVFGIALTLCVSFWFASACYATVVDMEINTSQSVLEGRIGFSSDLQKGILTAGGGGIYNDDEYELYYAYIAMGNEIVYRGLVCSLGFKTFTGTVEKQKQEEDVGAVGFLAGAYYEAPIPSSSLRFFWDASACAAPRPLSFQDTERFLEIQGDVGLYVLTNAAFLTGYRYLRIRFDDQARFDKRTEEAVYIGYRMSF